MRIKHKVHVFHPTQNIGLRETYSVPWVRYPAGNFSFHYRIQNGSGSTQPPIQWVPKALSLGVKRPGRKTDHSPSSSAVVKECVELYFHSPIHLHGAVLSLKEKHRDNFTVLTRHTAYV
jgi:hypothetical protein